MNDALFAFLIGLGAFLFVLGIITFIFYCFLAVGLMTMAKRRGIENAWLAWIPIANYYILGQLIGTIDFGDKKIDNAPMVLLVGSIGVIVLSYMPVIGTLASLVFLVLTVASLYKLYLLYKPGSEVLYLVLSIIFPWIAIGLIIFNLRNNDPAVSEVKP